jgi:hypothetical protein
MQGPKVTFETVASASAITNSDQSTLYFSPKQASAVGVAFVLSHVLKSDANQQWKQKAVIEPTLFSQAGIERKMGATARYEQEWELQSKWGGRVAVQVTRRPFDGRMESRTSLGLELFRRI